MNRCIGLIMIVCLLCSCVEDKKQEQRKEIHSVEISAILQDSLLSIRAIEVLDDGNLAFGANHNTYGLYDGSKESLLTSTIQHDSLDLEFRAVAHTSTDFLLLSVASPGLLYKTGNEGRMVKVYEETHQLTFYDSMKFWNDQEGIAIGDATGNCLSIVITRDGGQTWTKLSCEDLPPANQGNSAFAASNTNIAIVGDKTWVATGGKVSNVLFSPDKGKTWEVQQTPIMQETETEGMYSIDFYNESVGFAIGGDYTATEKNHSNKIRTVDGGQNWELVAENKFPGYRSCVQYIPGGNGDELVAVSSEGIDYSHDSGESWRHLSDEGFYSIRFIDENSAYASGSGKISKLNFKRN